MTGLQHIANDNEKPATRSKVAHFARPAERSRPKPTSVPTPIFGKSKNIERQRQTAQQGDKIGLGLVALIVWIGTIAALLFTHQHAGTPLQILGVRVGFGWASLFLLHISKQQQRPFYRTLAMLGTLLSLALIGFSLHVDFNIHLTGGLALSLGVALTLALGALTQEKLPLLISVILSAFWVGTAHFTPSALQLAWLVPTFLILQYWLSSKMGAHFALVLTGLTALAWIYSNVILFAQSGALPTPLVLGLSLLFAIAYNRIGKTMQDGNKPHGLWHTNIAWGLGICSALGLQYIWSSPTEFLQNTSIIAKDTTTLIGVSISMALALIIIATSISRTRSGRQSRGETLALTATALFLILLLNNPEPITGWLATMTATPLATLSQAIGGILAAASLSMVVNGARRGKSLMIILGIVALIAELYMVLPHLAQHTEHLYVFGYAGLFSLLFMALFAQNNMSKNSQMATHYASEH